MKLIDGKRVSKNYENILIELDRSSVCMADDIDSHELNFEIIKNTSLSELIDLIFKKNYLPLISGDIATWVVLNKRKSLAVLSQRREVLYIRDRKLIVNEIAQDGKLKVFIRYYQQEDLNKVYKKMKK
jgi:hypothetical protein